VEDLHFTSQPDASLAPLKSLSALTNLELCEFTVSPAGMSELAAVTQLRSLQLCDWSRDAPYELQQLAPLTALTGLTWLHSNVVELKSKVNEQPQWWRVHGDSSV
jgi:hypothetical protein